MSGSLAGILDKADAALENGESSETTEKVPEKAPEKKVDDKAPPPAEDESGLTEKEQQTAKDLFLSLKDPATSKIVLKAMVEAAGLKLDGTETKEEIKEVKKSVEDVLKEGLGEEYDFLVEKLGPALKKIINDAVDEKTADLRKTTAETERERYEVKVEKAFTALDTKYGDTKEFHDSMLKLMDDMPPSPNLPIDKYFENLYLIVSGGKKSETVAKKAADKLAANRKDAPSRIASEGKVEPGATDSTPKKRLSISEAIKASMEELEK